jgi:hypothetical protein
MTAVRRSTLLLVLSRFTLRAALWITSLDALSTQLEQGLLRPGLFVESASLAFEQSKTLGGGHDLVRLLSAECQSRQLP